MIAASEGHTKAVQSTLWYWVHTQIPLQTLLIVQVSQRAVIILAPVGKTIDIQLVIVRIPKNLIVLSTQALEVQNDVIVVVPVILK